MFFPVKKPNSSTTMVVKDEQKKHHDMSRNGIKWSDVEIDQLLTEIAEKSIAEIAVYHQRAYSSIKYKLLQHAVRMYKNNVSISNITKILQLTKKDIMQYCLNNNIEISNDSFLAEKQVIQTTSHVPIPMFFLNNAKGIILFDLNGTLCYRSKCNKEIFIRPCIQELNKLRNYFRVGIYTSVTRTNTLDILRQIEEKCGRIFDRRIIFTREQTEPFTDDERILFNIPEYKTKKSIAKVLPEIFSQFPEKIKIVDDEEIKIVEKEHAIIIPSWDGYSTDTSLKHLIEQLINL
jgi:hypothetical protein